MPTVDLRSDTVTHPTEAMREAMHRAAVGDDVYGEDPTVNRLEALAAARLGKEAAVYVPSGTMANTTAIMTHTRPGDEAIVEDQAHVYRIEGSMVAIAGVIPRLLRGERGTITAPLLAAALAAARQPPRLLCLENTHNLAGGTVMTPQQMREVCALAKERGLRVHLDGARIFNAAVALAVDVKDLVRDADSVMFCISKGLSAPVGSVLCGDADFIGQARRRRKYLGGGMRQAGVIAAAGIVALETMVDRLAEDHRHARVLAQRLAALPGVRVELEAVQTNMVMVDVADAPAVAQRLAERDVRVSLISPTRLRLVTHRHIGGPEVEQAVAAFEHVMGVAAGRS
jgi:threonine aldolase